MNRYIYVIREKCAYFAVIISIVGIIFLLSRGATAFVNPIIGVFLGGIVAIFLSWENDNLRESSPIDLRIVAITWCTYVVTMIFIYLPVFAERPFGHYVLFSLGGSFIAIQIHRNQPTSHVLVGLFLFSIITYWSSQFVYPGGAANIDTDLVLVGINEIRYSTFHLNKSVPRSDLAIHHILVVQVSEILNLNSKHGYIMLATITLAITTLLLGLFDRTLPSISRRTALYSTLFFATLPFVLRRGFFPQKGNFFKPLIALCIFIMLMTIFKSPIKRKQYLIIGYISSLAIIFGHTYSAGALLLILNTIWIFTILYTSTFDFTKISIQKIPNIFLIISTVVFLSYSYFTISGAGILGRISNLILSIIPAEPTGSITGGTTGGTTGGRFSEQPFLELIIAYSSQILIWALATLGAVVGFKFGDQDMDTILAWIGTGLCVILFSVILNATDIPTPRIYILIGLFGINITAAIGLQVIASEIPEPLKQASILAIITILLVSSLASPTAGVILSPLTDSATYTNYDFISVENGDDWINEFGKSDRLKMDPPTSQVPITINETRSLARVDRTGINSGQQYEYNTLAERNGLLTSNAQEFGNRIYMRTRLSNCSVLDHKLYSNNNYAVYQRTQTDSPNCQEQL